MTSSSGLALEANVKDARWLHQANNVQHINLAELDAVLKELNRVVQWQAKVLHIGTDSACIY